MIPLVDLSVLVLRIVQLCVFYIQCYFGDFLSDKDIISMLNQSVKRVGGCHLNSETYVLQTHDSDREFKSVKYI